MKISPLPWWATEPVRASPSPARRATRSSELAAQRRIGCDDGDAAPRGRRATSPVGGAGRPGAPATRSCRQAAPKLARTSTPTAWPAATRLALPMPPFQPRQLMPVPAPTAPRRSRSAATARGHVLRSTCTIRASFSQPSSHSATTGMRTCRRRPADRLAPPREIAPSKTRPTAWSRSGTRASPIGPTRGSATHRSARPSHSARRPRPRAARSEPRQRDRGHTGAGDAAAFRRVGLVAPDRDVADADAGDVDDRIAGPGSRSPIRRPSSRRRRPRGLGGVSATGGL